MLPVSITISKQQREAMLAHILSCLPEEACGFISGTQSRVAVSVIPITNELHSHVSFRMAPDEQIRALLQIEENDLYTIAVYHSHPNGPDQPSESDIDQFHYPGVVQLIWAPKNRIWYLKGFIIENCLAKEAILNLPDVT
jgi:[CysO sulfur-carrier protein]-S-L-cysteine hydrolase